MGITISAPDALRQSVEAASGGANTVLYDAKGYPSVMCVVPRFNIEDIDPTLGSGAHPAFIVNGVEKSEIFVGKYLARVHDGSALSMPGQDPSTTINFDAAGACCEAKGPGWHMMTNAEWTAVALWCWRNGFMPRGNTNFGRDHLQTYETGRRQDGGAPGGASGNARTLTGSGPAGWSHDGTPAGIFDLCGNVWEWQRGLRLLDGEIQVIPHNDAAAPSADHGASSALWRAIMPDGALVAPGTAGTLKWNATGVAGAGSPQLAASVTSQSNGTTEASQQYKDVGAAGGIAVPGLIKLLGLYPHATTIERGRLYVRNVGERLPLRGGNWGGGGSAGVFALNLGNGRAHASASLGFRPAFVI